MAKRSRTAAERAAQLARLRTRPARAQMLTAARELATARGYESIKAGDIASAAGVSRETFYTHFADKRSCLAEATEPRLGEIESELRIAAEEEEPWAAPILESIEATLQERYGSRTSARSRIIEAMLALVAEHGYASVRLADVIKAAHASYPTFYRQFESKQDCFATAYAALIARLEAQVPARLEGVRHTGAGPTPRLVCLAEILAAEPVTARILIVEGAAAERAGDSEFVGLHSLGRLLERLIIGAGLEQSEDDVGMSSFPLRVGAVLELIRDAVIGGRLQTLPQMVPSLARLYGASSVEERNGSALPPRSPHRRSLAPTRARQIKAVRSTRASERKPLNGVSR